MLISMIHDENEYIRELGWRRILKARRSASDLVRVFKVPALNFSAQSYFDMVDWQSLDLTEPPLTKNIETETSLNSIVHVMLQTFMQKLFHVTLKQWNATLSLLRKFLRRFVG